MSYDYDGPWVLLDSDEGQKLLAEANERQTSSYDHLIGQFHKQIGSKNCGYASSACVLSSLKVTHVKEADLVANEQLGVKVRDPKLTAEQGMPLKTVCSIAQFFGAQATFYPMREVDADGLRDKLKECVCDNKGETKAMVVNFWCQSLKLRVPYGHISVAAAFHEETDKILVLDTYMTTHNAWYAIEDMARAMNTVDEDGQEYRGFVIISTL